jgi:hypothetical protein
MSISSSANRNDYVGNGATDTYNYSFRIFDEADLEVTVRDTSDVETTLALSTDYTVTGVGSSGGGTIVLVNSAQSWLDGDGDLKSSYALTIRRVLDLVQETDIRNQGAFYPEIHEDQFDKLVMIAQQQQDELSRSASMPVTVAASAFSPEFPASLPSNPGATIVVNDAGDGFDLGPTADQISSANADAVAAAASAAAALVSENNAEASELAAAASAASAAAVIAGLTPSRAVVTDGSGVLASSAATSTEVGYLSGVSSAIQTQLNAKAPSASPTLTTPSTDVVTLDGQGSTPTSPSSGFYKLYVKDSTNKLTVLDSSGNETSVGAGGGGINLITNGDGEGGTTGWATYADAAGTRPVDGTGGSPNVTWTTSATTPLYGVNSFLFTKDAANRQGQGVSYAFTVQPAHQAKVLNISFDYIVSSGTFVAGTSSTDSDIIAYIYDVTNGQLIEPSSIKLLSNSSSIADRFNATFQTSATGTSYRLILHCASTSASAYVVKFDNIQVSPSNYSYGTPITDWQSYTPTTQGFGTITNAEFYWRRVGSNIELDCKWTNGTTAASEARIGLPSGFTSIAFTQGIRQAGNFVIFANTTTAKVIPLIESSVTYVTFGNQDGASGFTKINGNVAFSSSNLVSFKATIPCVGLSSSVQMSDQQDTRVVDFMGYVASNQSITSMTTNINLTAYRDSHGAWNGSQFTVPVAGDYLIGCNIPWTTSPSHSTYVFLNGSSSFELGHSASTDTTRGTCLLHNLKVGDIISFRDGTLTTSANTDKRTWITRIAGPNQIAASETIAASYYCSTNQAATSSAPFNFDTKEYDSHGAVTTGVNWKFTAPSAGLYEVLGYIEKVTATTSGFDIYKKGSLYKRASASLSSGVTYSNFYASLRLIAGDYIELRPSASITIYGGSLTSASHIAIKRIGL